MTLVLSRHSTEGLNTLLPREGIVYDRLLGELTKYVGSDHARMFARPEYTNDMVRWSCDGQDAISWKNLTTAQQEQSLSSIRSVLLDIQASSQRYPNSFFAQYFHAYRQVPSEDYIYLVDGRPMLTAWGYAGLNGSFDPLLGFTSDHQRKNSFLTLHGFPWLTSLIALAFGIGGSLIWAMMHHDDKACHVTYPPKALVESALQDKDKHKQLLDDRDRLQRELDDLAKQCKIPPVQPLVPKDLPQGDQLLPELPKTPEVPAVPNIEPLPDIEKPNQQQVSQPKPAPKQPKQETKPKGDLPKESWDKKDTSMLNGCWKLTTHLELYQRKLFFTSHQPITNWSLCFSPNGTGKQVLTRRDGGTCTGPLQATFQGSTLALKQPRDCQGDFHLIPGQNSCVRLNDREARCTYTDVEGHQSSGIFRR